MFLIGTADSVSVVSRYEHDDETGLGPSGLNIPMRFNIRASVDRQSTGSAATREAFTYSVLDIKTGDWVSDNSGNKCLKIISIIEIDENLGTIEFIVEDIDAYSYKTYKSNTFSKTDSICFFEVSDSGEAIIAANSNYFFGANTGAIDKLQARFQIREKSESYRLIFDSPQTLINEGDVVTINTSGNLVPVGYTGAIDHNIGFVISKSYNDTVIYLKPFNEIIDDFVAPERLTGSIGDEYYSSNSVHGGLTTNPALGGDKMFLHFKDAIPTVVQSTLDKISMVEGDSLSINGTSIFNILGSGVIKTTLQIANEINLHTHEHHVTASVYVPPAVNYSSKVVQPVNGDVLILVNQVGTSTPILGTLTISDGTNSTVYAPSTTDTVYTTDTGVSYNTISANQIAQDLNALFISGNIDIVADTFIWDQANYKNTYPGLRLTAGAGKDINITNGNFVDYTGATFTDALGLESLVSTSSLSYLTLTRNDGGDIMLQGEGSFVNRNGIVSSSSGTPALLFLIDEEEEVIITQGIPTDSDQDMIPNVTSSDGDSTGMTISYTPHRDGLVQIYVNGLGVGVGDGTKSAGCYFSSDGGSTAKTIENIEAGDTLYWNGSIAGYELDGGDSVDFMYERTV